MRNGNRHTALRWAAFLRGAGHKVDVSVQWAPDSRVDAMLALHARRSYPSIKTFSSDKLLVVALTGTDVYRDIHDSAEARESLELAHRLIVLQPKAAQELPPGLRRKGTRGDAELPHPAAARSGRDPVPDVRDRPPAGGEPS
jgi:hypothetical protein